MRINQLLQALPQKTVLGNDRVDISSIVSDSRQASPGTLFVAISGTMNDGLKYIPQAITNGAVAVVTEQAISLAENNEENNSVVQIIVPNARQALAWLAAAFYGYPGRQLRVVGVTGTDGKTTTASIISSILRSAKQQIGVITTVSAEVGNQLLETGLHTTTPSPLEVQYYLREMVKAGAKYAVLETTSHALDQERTLGSEYDIAVVTNVTRDHLDYHKTYEAYLATKGRLFESLAASRRKRGVKKVSVLNLDDRSYAYLSQFAADVTLTYGLTQEADIWASDIELTPSGTSFMAHTPRGTFAVKTPLLGMFNVYNCLAAGAVAISQNISPAAIKSGLAGISRVVGRLDPIDLGQGFGVLIDFAHTPNSLEQVLKLARTLTKGKITIVFGCAGLRDRDKRPIMGEIAGRLADFTVITAEDPRTEDLAEIMEQIAVGSEQAGAVEGRQYWKIGDREEAINFAIRHAQPEDLVLITGKGHEKSMCFGEEEYPWSDYEAATHALQELQKETQ